MRIGIDIDGVLTDVKKWQLDYASKFFAEKYNMKIINYKGYEISDIFDVDDKLDNEFWDTYYDEYCTNIECRRFAGEVIKKLKDEGHEIYIITARYLTNRKDKIGKKYQDVVLNWLDKNKIQYDKIIYSPEDKLNICIEEKIDLMIEDKVDNIMKISDIIPVICFHANYNEQCIRKNVIRCYSWYDIYMNIRELNDSI